MLHACPCDIVHKRHIYLVVVAISHRATFTEANPSPTHLASLASLTAWRKREQNERHKAENIRGVNRSQVMSLVGMETQVAIIRRGRSFYSVPSCLNGHVLTVIRIPVARLWDPLSPSPFHYSSCCEFAKGCHGILGREADPVPRNSPE